jgi:hypothetical protein
MVDAGIAVQYQMVGLVTDQIDRAPVVQVGPCVRRQTQQCSRENPDPDRILHPWTSYGKPYSNSHQAWSTLAARVSEVIRDDDMRDGFETILANPVRSS